MIALQEKDSATMAFVENASITLAARHTIIPSALQKTKAILRLTARPLASASNAQRMNNAREQERKPLAMP